MSKNSVLTIRLVGGHPALDLLNTVDPDRVGDERDVLRSFSDDARWAMRIGLLTEPEGECLLDLGRQPGSRANRAHRDLLLAREAVRSITRAEVEATAVDPAATEEFERAVATSIAHRRFSVAETPYGWRWLPGDIDAVRHRVILSAADLLTDTARRRVSVCAGPNCDWYFLDTSKSGKRRWCSDASCGTSYRVRRLRHRKRAGD